ncbi:HET-domain-containing protein [Paraphaeosphaeria sporulosa]|uniref:HET-domain-containing protein n=1 Tax=Paraphaeosphaeria sporulosa TaxID=1460663 RepID=A0A177CRH6_9PLEO|nr:HET-domain-containing protein [Paraphaeosphaeria sporulosa]OAG09369.1 HET-domain-containing protein [Paraphaeosphaeria sporulosa]
MSTATLCLQCRKIFSGPRIPETPDPEEELERWTHHLTGASMQQAAEEGCLICRPAWSDMVEKFGIDDLLTEPQRTPALGSGTKGTQDDFTHYTLCNDFSQYRKGFDQDQLEVGGGVELGIGRTPVDTYHDSYVVHLFPLEDLRVSSLPRTQASPETKDTILLMQKWVDECVALHPECQQPSVWNYPTRIVDVGTEHDETVRLSITAKERLEGAYATLSHCWGAAVPFRLLESNLDELTTHIDVRVLPQTFQDAVLTVRALGIRYIWIDSLCIIQDSAEDWQAEAAQMAQVYGNAFCCLAATWASDGTQGLYPDRHPRLDQVVTSWEDAPNFTYIILPEYFTGDAITRAPLNDRAWVYQERTLSKRIIHFAEEQVFWECRRSFACECLPSGLPTMYQSLQYWQSRPLTLLDSKSRGHSGGDMSAWHSLIFWEAMIREYTGKRLSHPTDRLIAISGIARLLNATLDDAYVAGMWKWHLEEQLIWYAASPEEARPSNRGPSWSWGSLDGKIIPSNVRNQDGEVCQVKIIAHVREIEVEPVSNDIYGQIRKGMLMLDGCVYPVRPGSLRKSPYQLPGLEFSEWHSEDLEFTTPYGDVRWDTQQDKRSFDEGLPLYWLPVTLSEYGAEKGQFYFLGLLLKRQPGAVTHVYSRVGYFSLTSAGMEALETFLSDRHRATWMQKLIIQ